MDTCQAMNESVLTPYFKDKIGKHLSWPLKFSEVVSQLDTRIQEQGLEVWFSDSKSLRANDTRQTYRVIDVTYYPPDRMRPIPTWQLFISPVPRSMRSVVRSLLLPLAMERVKTWLSKERTPVWLSSGHSLRIDFLVHGPALKIHQRK
jgi:hypothetical protein